MYSLNYAFKIIPAGPSKIYLDNKKTGKKYVVTSSKINLISLVKNIVDGNNLSSAYSPKETEDINDLLAQMIALGFLLVSDDQINLQAPDDRLTTQYNYLSRHEATQGISRFDLQDRISHASVVLLGVGSLGTWIAQHLVTMGVRHLILIDPDIVQTSNLSRVCLFDEDDVGLAKVICAKRTLYRIRSDIRVDCVDDRINTEVDLIHILNGKSPTLLILTGDEPAINLAVSVTRACKIINLPQLRVNSIGVGPLYIPDRPASACSMCDFFQYRENIPDWREIVASRELLKLPGGGYLPEISGNAALAASEIIHYLIDKKSSHNLLNKRVKFLPQSHELKIANVPKYTACGGCGGQVDC